MGEPQRSRGTYRHGDLKAELLRFGLDLARQGGPEAVVLREATRLAGVTPHAAYRHFEDKEALLTAVSERAFSMLADRLERELSEIPECNSAAGAARSRLRAVGTGYIGFAFEEPNLFRTAFSVPVDLSTAMSHSKAGRQGRTPYEILQATIEECAASGAIPPGRQQDARIFSWSAVHGFATLIVSGPLRGFSSEAVQLSTRALLDRVDQGI
jgi:AcrR family transcriptional regulator